MQETNEKIPCNDNNLKTNMAVFKACLETLKADVEHITEIIERLTKETTEYQMQMKYVYNDVEKVKEYYNDIKSINESIVALQKSVDKLELAFNKHLDVSNTSFTEINSEVSKLKSQMEQIPLIYQPKPLTRSIGDVIRMAPGLFAIISAVITLLVIYLKGVL